MSEENKARINPISDESVDKIKRKSAYSLPDSPSAVGIKPAEIKKAFYSPLTDKADSVVSEINRLVGEANSALAVLEEDKLSRVAADGGARAYGITESGEQTLFDVSEASEGSTLARRTEEGNIFVSDPTEPSHAASRGYTDALVERVTERVSRAEDRIGASETDGQVAYPELNTDNTAIIPAVNELLALLLSSIEKLNGKAERVDTATSGYFEHNGNATVYGNVEADTVKGFALYGDDLSSSRLTVTDNATVSTLNAGVVNADSLNVSGTATVKEQEEILIRDSVIVLNSDGESIEGTYSGIVIRADARNAYAILLDVGSETVRLGYGSYNEVSNAFVMYSGEDGAILTRPDSTSMTDGGVLAWDAESFRAVCSSLDRATADELYSALVNRTLPEYEGRYVSISGGRIALTPPEALVSVESVEQTTRSSVSGGENVMTVTLTDGSKSAFRVRNGEKGATGDKGDKGDAGEVSFAYANSTYSPALKGDASGGIVSIDDVSPLEHELAINISRRNLIPYPYANTTKTTNGITFTVLEDGGISMTGTATANAQFYLDDDYKYFSAFVGIAESVNTKTSDGLTLSKSGDGASKVYIGFEGGRLLYILVATGTVCSGETVYVQIEKGSSATGYVPYVSDLSGIKVRVTDGVTCPYPYISGAEYMFLNGVTFTAIEGGGLRRKGTATGGSPAYFFKYESDIFTVGETYRLSEGINMSVNTPDGVQYYDGSSDNNTVTWLDTYSVRAISSQVVWGNTVDDVVYPVFYVDRQDEYETDADGEVTGAVSLSPRMCVYAMADGVRTEVTYNRDANKVIEKLTNAIISLGGNI